LKNLIKRAVVMGESAMLSDFPGQRSDGPALPGNLESRPGTGYCLADEVRALEKALLKQAVRRCRTTRELSSALGISQPTAVRKMKKYKLSFANDSKLNQ
jgi:DNA-binding NtrC family response regulator